MCALLSAVESAGRILIPKFGIEQELEIPRVMLANTSAENMYKPGDNTIYLKTRIL